MNRTQENITKYKELIPGLKEKLAAAVLVFVMSAAMLVTSTFAWLTLSYNPQVQNVHTAIASNGNLEIALATGEMASATAPGASKEGDSKLPIVERNITWGNLINLNDPAYGLKHLVLRPSLLNDSNLIERPLYGPVYDPDGRVIDMNTNFGYSEYDTFNQRFTATNKLGVRAITSMKYGTSGTQNLLNMELNAIADANIVTQNEYLAIAQADENQKYMDALASMMTGYMVENYLKKSSNSLVVSMLKDAELTRSDIAAFAEMYQKLIDSFEAHAKDVADLLTFEAKMLGKVGLTITKEEIFNLEYDKTNKTACKKLLEMGFETYADSNKTVGVIKSIDSFLYDYNVLQSDLVRLNGLYNSLSGDILWKNCPSSAENDSRLIDDIINNLTDVGKCTITGGEYKDLPIKSVGAGVALNLKGKLCETKITNGILFNFDNYTGGRIRNKDGKPLRLTVQAMGEQTIESNVSTSATLNHFESERAYVAKIIADKYGAPELIANDSYGFAVDFWVRTNAHGSFLTLEGNVLTKTETVDVKGKNAEGEEVQLYTITVKLEDEESSGGGILDNVNSISYDVYESTHIPEGSSTEVDCLRFAENHEVVTEESLGGQAIPNHLKKVEEIETVIGYEGENRIWNGEEHSLLTVSSTTQGSGSCYTFYAETPTDQKRSLKLLKSMKIAFVDEQGVLLTTAYMNTEKHYASSGKVIVPIVLSNESISIGEDDNGDLRFAITALDQNVPKRISAVVYLDGTNLTNEDVLAAADIQGQMNIQFGSSAALVPLDNEALYISEFYAEVEEIKPDTFDYDTLEDGAKMESNVKVRISGTQPNQVTATFIRRINATQGSPEDEFQLKDDDGDGVWEGSYEFKYPGTYILRSVVVDGVERDLKIPEGEDFPSVLVKGFSITRVSYEMSEFIMTDVDHYSGNVSLHFTSDNPEKMPKTVVGKFVCDDGSEVNVNFAYNATTASWAGTANFTSSGEYTMQYVVLDGQYVELAESQQKTVDLTLGMRVNVETSSPTTIFYGEENAPTKLAMQVKILDNNNDIIKSLADVTLTYKMTETEKLEAVLKYNSGRQWYEGEFNVDPGTWKFDNVTIKMGNSSTNELRKVNTDAPVFQIIPPDPPSYLSNFVEKVQYRVSDKYASFAAKLADSGSAVVYAKLENEKGETLYVAGNMAETSINGQYDYEFVIEDTGYWTMKSVSVFDAFDQDQNFHPVPTEMNEDNYNSGIVFDASNSTFTEISSAVLYQEDIKVNYAYKDIEGNNVIIPDNDKTIILGKDEEFGDIERTFMEATSLPDGLIEVTINDTANLISQGYFNVENVTLSYKYGSLTDSSGKSYGSYVSSDYDNGIKGTNVGTLNFAAKKNTLFALTNANGTVNFDHSAQYTADKLNYTITSDYDTKVSETTEIENAGAHPVVCYSKAPSVTVEAVTPTGNYSVDNTTSASVKDTVTTTKRVESTTDSCGNAKDTTYYTHTWNTHASHKSSTGSFISADKLTATVYFKCFHSNDATYDGGSNTTDSSPSNERYHTYYTDSGSGFPTVTLNLQGISGFTSAKLNVNNNAGIYATSTYTGSGWATTGVWETKTPNSDYTWTNVGNVTRNIGYGKSQKSRWSDQTNATGTKTPAGTITADKLEVVYSDANYTFTIDKVTINNPY
ncbi:MAG: hypothetical protein IKJ50_05930 [Clostridia bacterium]|nr:hypothetical protein [Clostridia bacterium]